MPNWWRRADFLAGKSTRVQAKLGGRDAGQRPRIWISSWPRSRDRLKALTFIQGSQAINAEGVGDADIFALACKGGTMGIQAFFIRGGQNWGHRSFFPAHTNDVPEDEVFKLPRAILRGRAAAADDPRRSQRWRKAHCSPRRWASGGRQGRDHGAAARRSRRLLEQAKRNAEEALDRRLAESTTQAKLLRELAELFELEEPPDRIEIYDNSHIQGTNALGAMVVAGPEGFRKGAYRKFNIKRAETIAGRRFRDDARSDSRRFARAQEEDPDRRARNGPIWC
jgi:excinuclease ABC subunit C